MKISKIEAVPSLQPKSHSLSLNSYRTRICFITANLTMFEANNSFVLSLYLCCSHLFLQISIIQALSFRRFRLSRKVLKVSLVFIEDSFLFLYQIITNIDTTHQLQNQNFRIHHRMRSTMMLNSKFSVLNEAHHPNCCILKLYLISFSKSLFLFSLFLRSNSIYTLTPHTLSICLSFNYSFFYSQLSPLLLFSGPSRAHSF